MKVYYFNHINLPFKERCDIIFDIIKIVARDHDATQRTKFGERFIEEGSGLSIYKEAALGNKWYPEYVNRLFWVCCELGLLQYQYPYPHIGQTYRLTRLGRILAARPRSVCRLFVVAAYLVSATATPIQYFSKVRNFITVTVGAIIWLVQGRFSGFLVGLSLAAGVVSTWIASFLIDWEE